jgi:hypothetical protein
MVHLDPRPLSMRHQEKTTQSAEPLPRRSHFHHEYSTLLSEAVVGVDSRGLIMLNPTALMAYFIGRLRIGYAGHEF